MKKRIVCAIIAFLIILSSVLSLSACDKNVNYLKDDLSKYIEISEADYKNYKLDIKYDSVDSSDVDRKIMQLLYQNKNASPEYNGGNVKNLPISVGDTVYIYYRGYTVDENGVERDIEKSSNLTGEIYSLGIGSGKMVKGFEEGLVGKNPNDYEEFELIKSGKVKATDVIYLSYSVMLPDGTMYSRQNERIDLSASYTDDIYGIGFSKFFTGATVGSKIPSSQTFEMEDGSAVYYEMTVNYKTNCEKNPITVDVHFPMDYSNSEELRGVDAKFDVYVRYINIYKTPEYNDEFIKNTLKITEEDLAEYEGGTLVEKHRAKILEELTADNEERRKSIKEEAMWDYYNSKVKVKKLPKNDVDDVYEEYYYETVTTYQTYYAYAYDSLDAFARAYYKLSANEDWQDYITERAKGVIVEKMLFYYIIRREGFIPEKSEFETLYQNVVNEYLDYYANQFYKSELDAIKDEEEKAKKLSEIKEEMLSYYGDTYFDEIVYYDYALEKIMAFGIVEE